MKLGFKAHTDIHEAPSCKRRQLESKWIYLVEKIHSQIDFIDTCVSLLSYVKKPLSNYIRSNFSHYK